MFEKRLYDACSGGDLVLLKTLVEHHKVAVNCYDVRTGTNPLMCAVDIFNTNFEVIKYLVEHGADVNARHKVFGSTSLHLAARNDNARRCAYLVSQGADVNARAKDGWTPLVTNLMYRKDGEPTVLRVLLEAGAAFDDGISVFLAVQHSLSCLKLFMDHEANPDLRDPEGNTLLHMAVGKHTRTCCEICTSREFMYNFSRRNSDEGSGYHRKHPRSGHRFQITRFLIIQQNASVYEKNSLGETAFDRAISAKRLTLAKLLVNAGYSPGSVSLEHQRMILKRGGGEQFLSFLESMTNSPRTLRDLCCFRIRQIIGRRVSSGAIDILPLPTVVKEYVSLSHL